MAIIYHQVLIKSSASIIYQNITTSEGLSQWWIKDCTAKAEVGFINEFRVPNLGTTQMQVIELEANLYVAWKCLNTEDVWTDTEIHFALSTKGEYTCLNFKHIGYKEEDEMYATCNYHWARHLFMLKHLCETGHSILNEELEAAEVAAVHET